MDVLSNHAFNFLKHLGTIYKSLGKNEFYFPSYTDFPDYQAAICELVDKGYLNKSNDIVGKLSINLEKLNEY